MDLEQARELMRTSDRGVLAARRPGGGIRQCPILVAVDGERRAIVSSRETACTVEHLRRDPWVRLCAFSGALSGGRWSAPAPTARAESEGAGCHC